MNILLEWARQQRDGDVSPEVSLDRLAVAILAEYHEPAFTPLREKLQASEWRAEHLRRSGGADRAVDGADVSDDVRTLLIHAGLTPREADAVLATEPGQRLSAAPSEDTRCFYTFLAKDAVRAVRCGFASGHDGRHSVEEPAASSEAAPVLPPPDLELIDVMQEGEDKTVYS